MVTTPKKVFLGASIGTLIEFYDVSLLSFFLPIVAPLFFPSPTVYDSLQKGYIFLFITSLARPLGALFFGYFGDAKSRRWAILATIYGIALSTLLIGITPTYASIGILATIILFLARALQMFSFGGEYNGAGTYVEEHASKKNEILWGSLLIAIGFSGGIFGSIIGAILTSKGMPEASWRIGFIIGSIAGTFGFLYRRNFLESPNFVPANKSQGFIELFRQFPLELLAGFFIGGIFSMPFSTIFTFINPVLVSKGILSTHQLMLLQMLPMLATILTLILVGFIARKMSYVKVMKLGCWLIILCFSVLLAIVDLAIVPLIILALTLLMVITAIFLAPTNAFLKNAFAMPFRYRGSSLSFCIGVAVIGGLTPVVEYRIYDWTNRFAYVSLWPILIAIGVLVFIPRVSNKQKY